MIKLILTILLLICLSPKIKAQLANRLPNVNATMTNIRPTNFLFVNPFSSPTNQIFPASWDTVANMLQQMNRWKLSSYVPALAITGMSLTAGGNTVVIPGMNMSDTTESIYGNSAIMYVGKSNTAVSGINSNMSAKLNSTDTSGIRHDLNNKLYISNFTWSNLSGKPSFATVATSGDYYDLSNKPTLFSGAYTDLTGKPTLFSGSFTDLTSKPTTLSGYGITDAQSKLNGIGFIKASGTAISYDNSTYLTSSDLSGYVTTSAVSGSISTINSSINSKAPLTRNLTINGTSQDLSSDRTWSIPTGSVYSAGSSISITGSVIANTSPNQVVSITGAGITNITGTYPNFIVTSTELDGSPSNEFQTVSGTGTKTLTLSNSGGIWSPPAIVSNAVTRALTTSFTISLTQDMNVDYSVYSQVSSALVGTNTAEVFLEISTTSGGTYTTIASAGVMAAGVLSTNGGTNVLSGYVPAGYWVRMRTVASGANSGSAVFTYKYGRENNN